MERTAVGTIVMSSVVHSNERSYPQGFITVLTTDEDYLTLDVDAYTSFETLEEDAPVLVACELLEGTDVWIARRVNKLDKNEIQERKANST